MASAVLLVANSSMFSGVLQMSGNASQSAPMGRRQSVIDSPVMNLESLHSFFANSSAVRLIRSPHAFWIVDFLHQQFKVAGKITRPHSELKAELNLYLDTHADSTKGWMEEAKSKSRDMAETYLASWCSGSIGWLKRFIDEQQSEPCYQLTAEFEKALEFVDRASRDSAFVGTESRLRTILELLGNMVSGGGEDRELRLRELRSKRDALNEEIRRLESTQDDSGGLTQTQIRERFEMAVQQLRQLQGEFRAVEDRFKSITRGVQQKILHARESRGDIVQFALDSEDMLKQGDQGQSFFEFLKMIHSPENQDRITTLVAQLSQLKELSGEHEDLAALRGMVPTLIAEAEKILRTTQHLSLTLRRLLDSRSTRHHQQLSHVLREIMAAAAQRSDAPPADIGLDIEVEIEIQSPMDRPFWLATEPFEEVELEAVVVDSHNRRAALEQLASLERLDWQEMRKRISRETREAPVPLTELLQRHPIQSGIVELLGYMQIAFDDGHRIDRTQTVGIELNIAGQRRRLRLPQVVFVSKANSPGQPAISRSKLTT